MENNVFNQLGQMEVQPPTGVWQSIATQLNNTQENVQPFIQLGSMEVAPPSFIWDKVAENLPSNNKARVIELNSQTNVKSGWFNATVAKYAAAASIIGLGLFFGVKSLIKPSTNDDNIAVNSATTVTPKNVEENNTPPQDSTDTLASNTNIPSFFDNKNPTNKKLIALKKAKPKQKIKPKVDPDALALKQLLKEGVIIDGSLMELEDEEFFVKLASYLEDSKLEDESKKLVVKFDNNRYMIITGKMSNFLRTLYKVNRRNKPTADARRLYRKLRRWKKSVVHTFDDPSFANILDPFSLAEFIDNTEK